MTHDEQCAVFRSRYAEADAALHKLMMGGAVASIRYGEKEVHYNRSNIDALQRYVSFLADKVAACDGTPRVRRHAIAVIPI